MLAGPVQSDGVIYSHSDVFAGRIPAMTTFLPYIWTPILSTFIHAHLCEFWAINAGSNGLLTSAMPGPEKPSLCTLKSHSRLYHPARLLFAWKTFLFVTPGV